MRRPTPSSWQHFLHGAIRRGATRCLGDCITFFMVPWGNEEGATLLMAPLHHEEGTILLMLQLFSLRHSPHGTLTLWDACHFLYGTNFLMAPWHHEVGTTLFMMPTSSWRPDVMRKAPLSFWCHSSHGALAAWPGHYSQYGATLLIGLWCHEKGAILYMVPPTSWWPDVMRRVPLSLWRQTPHGDLMVWVGNYWPYVEGTTLLMAPLP